MNLQAYIDDSGDDESGVYVLAGHIASVESWVLFAKEWERLLPHGTLAPNSTQYHFKMTEMALNEERLERVPRFYKVIEDHVLCSISCSFNRRDVEKAKSRIYIPNTEIDWGFIDNNYLLCFRLLMDMFHVNKAKLTEIIPLEQKVDFYFDSQMEAKFVDRFWDDYIEQRPQAFREYFGNRPCFADDKKLLPLQSADLWAWWVRKWVMEGRFDILDKPVICGYEERRDRIKIHISFDEEQIVAGIIDLTRRMLEPGRLIYDVRYFFS